MSYEEIFILGWNLNLTMFLANFFFVFTTLRSKSKEQLHKENTLLEKLKKEFDKYYPNRKYETMVSYAIPFTAFFRMSYRIIEMAYFLKRNEGTTMVDYMIYKYENDIRLAKNKIE